MQEKLEFSLFFFLNEIYKKFRIHSFWIGCVRSSEQGVLWSPGLSIAGNQIKYLLCFYNWGKKQKKVCISAVLRVCGNAQKIYPKNFQANADPPGNNYCEAPVFFRVFARVSGH